jgi:hypothetical protein
VTDEQAPAAPAPKATDKVAEADDIALQRVTALMAAIATDPLAVANQLLEWQNTVTGVHALLHAMVKRHIGEADEIVVPRADWQSIDPSEELKVDTDDHGDVHLWIKTKNRQERRAAARRKH